MRRIRQSLGVLAATALAVAGLSAGTASAATQPAVGTKAQWQTAIAHVRQPGIGCYRASYPVLRWQATRCVTAPPRVPLAPVPRSAHQAGPDLVGNGTDYSAKVSGSIVQATGTFANVSSGITEQGYPGGTGTLTANAFSLQLNSQFFAGSPACSGSGDPAGCQAWQQFVYTYENSSTSYLFMQYWLLNYDAGCPSGWTAYAGDCYTNSSTASVGTLTASQLATVQLSGGASSGGNDGVSLSVGSGSATLVTNSDSKIGLAAHWNTTEWGVYGDGGGSEAFFGSGTTLQAQTALTATSSGAPTCLAEGFTGETNNLTLTSTPALGSQPTPTMASRQTDGNPATASCAVAAGQPDTLLAGQELTGGQSLTNGDLSLVMGTDGNVVMENQGHAVWANGETGHSGAYLIMQSDGNLVEYYNGSAVWSSGTSGHTGAHAALTSTAGFEVVISGSRLWGTGVPNTVFTDPETSTPDVLWPGQSLGAPGQELLSANSHYSLYEYEGFLEEYINGTQDLVWFSGSSCSGASSTDMQTDGNLVTYCKGVAIWSSGTGGHPASYGIWLHLQTDGNVVLYSNYGGTIWSNGE
jgi:hypothetical protein